MSFLQSPPRPLGKLQRSPIPFSQGSCQEVTGSHRCLGVCTVPVTLPQRAGGGAISDTTVSGGQLWGGPGKAGRGSPCQGQRPLGVRPHAPPKPEGQHTQARAGCGCLPSRPCHPTPSHPQGPSDPGPIRQAGGRLCHDPTPQVEKQSPRKDDMPEATTGWRVDVGGPFFLGTRLLHLAMWLRGGGMDTRYCSRP